MKKFNKMESNLIVDSLNYYVANLESEIKQMEKDCFIARETIEKSGLL